MKFLQKIPPRFFATGRNNVVITDCGSARLQPDEQMTLTTERGAEYDLVRKSWGFYATPSLNGRLKSFNLRSALVKSDAGRYFVMLVEADREQMFLSYLEGEGSRVVCWLDDEKSLAAIDKLFAPG